MKIKNMAHVSLFALMLGVAGSLSSLSPVMADDDASKAAAPKVDGAKASDGSKHHHKSKSHGTKSHGTKSHGTKVDGAKASDASKVDTSKGTGAKSDGSASVLAKDGAGESKGPVAYHQTEVSKDGTSKTFVNAQGNHTIITDGKTSVSLNTDDSKVVGNVLAGLSTEDRKKVKLTAVVSSSISPAEVNEIKSEAQRQGLLVQHQSDGVFDLYPQRSEDIEGVRLIFIEYIGKPPHFTIDNMPNDFLGHRNLWEEDHMPANSPPSEGTFRDLK